MIALLTGRVPLRGELIVYPDGGPEFEILDADPRRIKKVAIRNVIQEGVSARQSEDEEKELKASLS